MTDLTVPVHIMDHGTGLPLPAYATAGSAGMDLVAAIAEPLTLKPGSRALIATGLRMALPQGYEAQVRPRSGLAIKNGITVLNTPGTIDSDYRGEVKVCLINLGDEDVIIERGARIAQMVLQPVIQATLLPVDVLDETARGAGGFGSTGTKS